MSYRINHLGRAVLFDTTGIRNPYLQQCADAALRKLFGYFLPSESKDVVLTFVLTDHLADFFKQSPDAIMCEMARTNETQAFMTGHGNGFGYDFEEGRLKRVYFQLTAPTKLNNEKNRPLSREFLSAVEQQINSFYTRGYLNSVQQVNIADGCTYLHACSFAINDEAYVVTATPGAGKSSLLLSLRFAEDMDFDFISDDFSAIDRQGHAHQIGRAMAVKSHQLQYFPQLEQVVQNMSRWQRLQWFLIKQRGLKYLASPQELFGDKITTDKPVKKVFYLTNHGKDTFEHEPMPISEFARLNANMLFSELYLGMEIFNHALMLPKFTQMNSVADFITKTRANIEACFADKPCTLVKVPFRSDPRDLLNFLCREKLLEV